MKDHQRRLEENINFGATARCDKKGSDGSECEKTFTNLLAEKPFPKKIDSYWASAEVNKKTFEQLACVREQKKLIKAIEDSYDKIEYLPRSITPFLQAIYLGRQSIPDFLADRQDNNRLSEKVFKSLQAIERPFEELGRQISTAKKIAFGMTANMDDETVDLLDRMEKTAIKLNKEFKAVHLCSKQDQSKTKDSDLPEYLKHSKAAESLMSILLDPKGRALKPEVKELVELCKESIRSKTVRCP